MATREEEKTVSVRSTRPNSYMFEIKSFSTLCRFVNLQTSFKYIESPEFESGGHKWKLCVYPNGNEKLGVDGHISLYLVAIDDEIDSNGSEISVSFKMFVYDYIRDNYLTIQDSEAKRFHRFQKAFGFAELISLEDFQDTRNGYLMNDCCEFGVEIFVLSPVVKSGSLSLIKKPKGGSFTWKFHNFSTASNYEYYSDAFVVHGHEWKLKILPNGGPCCVGTHLSMFLVGHNINFAGNSPIYTDIVLRVRDQLIGKHHEFKFPYCFSKSVTGGGFERFISLAQLQRVDDNGFVQDDVVIFEVEIISISETVSY